MIPVLFYKTKVGTFYICQSSDGKFHPAYDNETLGGYDNLSQAVEDIANNATFSVCHKDTGELLDTSEIGLPDDPQDWHKAKLKAAGGT